MWGFLCCKLGGATKSGRKILYTGSTHASHIASTTMRRTPQSATMSNENINCLYVNLHKVFRKHFSQSPENTAKLKKMLSFFLKWITFTCLHGVEPRFRILRWMQAEFCYFDSIFRHPGNSKYQAWKNKLSDESKRNLPCTTNCRFTTYFRKQTLHKNEVFH